jgi:hypothetical protein
MRIGIGQAKPVDLHPQSNLDIWEFRPDRGRKLADVRRAAERAALAPQDYPSIDQAIVDGDDVVLAVDANVPQLPQVVAGIIDALPVTKLGSVAVVLSDEALPETQLALRDLLASEISRGLEIPVEVHQPDDRETLGYLAANSSAEAIYLNRRLLDADLVIPVIVARPTGSLDASPNDGGVFPAFADAETQRRLRAEALAAGGGDDREASEAAWLLGIQFLVAVVPTAEADVNAIVAGTPAGIRRFADPTIESSWRRDSSRKASIVIACLDGDRQQQTWENVGRALHVARHLIRPGGTVVVTSQLGQPIGRSMRWLSGNEPSEKIEMRIKRDKRRDALTAALILQLQREGRVLLLSQLPADQVESLGIGVVEQVGQLVKLVEGHDSCAIVRAAQFCGIAS